MAGGIGGALNNPSLQSAINFAANNPQQPGQPQQPGNPFLGMPLNDPLNRGGMPFQGFNPAGTDSDPRRPFIGNPQPSMPQQPYNPQPLQNFQNMLQGQPQTQPMNPYEGMTQVGPGSWERLDGSPGSMQPSSTMTPLQKKYMDMYNPQRPQTQPMNTGYGQRPERGPAPRNLAPMGTQGLRGLMNMNRR